DRPRMARRWPRKRRGTSWTTSGPSRRDDDLLEPRRGGRRRRLPRWRPLGRRPGGLVDLSREPGVLVGARRDRPGDRGHDAAHRGAVVTERPADRADDRGLPAGRLRAVPRPRRGPDDALPVGDDAGGGEAGVAERALLLAADHRRRGGALRHGARAREVARRRGGATRRRGRAGTAE